MGTSAIEAREAELPKFRIITVSDQTPEPSGLVEVTPNAGRVLFQNNDPVEYRIRLVPRDNPATIDLLLPARGSVTVIIKKNDEFFYSLLDPFTGQTITTSSGPIKN